MASPVQAIPSTVVPLARLQGAPAAPFLLPLALERVPAGFPSPALDYLDESLDLTRQLVRNAAATFLVRAVGDSMVDAGIRSGDLLVVDRSLPPTPGAVVIAVLDGALTVKTYCLLEVGGVRRVALCAANDAYEPIVPDGDVECVCWGVVTYVIHRPGR